MKGERRNGYESEREKIHQSREMAVGKAPEEHEAKGKSCIGGHCEVRRRKRKIRGQADDRVTDTQQAVGRKEEDK